MTMSRMPAVLTMLLAAAASPAAGQSNLTTEQAFENYREMFEPPSATACKGEPDPEAIVVCGRRPAVDPNRLPLPVEREPGERIAGEPPSAVSIAGSREKCSTVGPNQNCGGGLPVMGIAMAVAKAASKVAEEVFNPDK